MKTRKSKGLVVAPGSIVELAGVWKDLSDETIEKMKNKINE